MLIVQEQMYPVKCYSIGTVSYRYEVEIFNENYPSKTVTRKAVYKSIQTCNTFPKKYRE